MALKDLPDWTTQIILRYEGGFIGLEELAARLGAVTPWNLHGNIVFMDDFETELTDWHDTGDLEGGVVRSSRHKFSGSWSVQLAAYVSEGITYGVLTRYFHYPGAGKYALFLRLGWDADLQSFTVRCDIYTGSRNLKFELVYDYLAGTLKVLTAGDTYYTVASDLYRAVDAVVFYPILLEFDLENEVYGTLYFGDQEYDLSAVPLYADDSSARPQCTLDVFPYGEVSEHTFYIYLNSIALANNVP